MIFIVLVGVWLLLAGVAARRLSPIGNRYDALYRRRYGGATDPKVLADEAWTNLLGTTIKAVRERDRMNATVASGVLHDPEIEAMYRLRQRRLFQLYAAVFAGPIVGLLVAAPVVWLLDGAGSLDSVIWTVVAWLAVLIEAAAAVLWARRLIRDEQPPGRLVALLAIVGMGLAVVTTVAIITSA